MSADTAISEATFREAVATAIRAPSLHNSQPWRFRLDTDKNVIEVRADDSRALPVADPDWWGLRIACGAATFNLRLAFAVDGRPLDVRWQPSTSDRALQAILTPAVARPATPEEQRLYRAVPLRHSNRRPFRPEPVPLAARAELLQAARTESAWLELVSGRVAVAAVAEITGVAHRALARNPAYLEEIRAWTRQGEGSSDGVPVDAAGPSPQPQDLFPQRPFGEHARVEGKDYEAEPLAAVLGTTGDLAADRLRAGHALQRVLLTITDLGLACSMLSQPIEVASAREELRLALGRYGTPQMVLRIGYGDPGVTTPRRSPAQVIDAAPHNSC
jgi:nitroreductase